jgi:phospholipase/carboxylesterase
MSAKNAQHPWLSPDVLFDFEGLPYENVLLYASSPTPQRVIMAFHGFGCDAKDLSSLPDDLKLKDTLWVFVSAPLALHPSESQRAWFHPFSNPRDLRHESKRLIHELTHFISQKVHVPFEHFFYLGFSQGGAMALYGGLCFPEKIAGIICLSGFLIEPMEILERLQDKISFPRVFIAHGTFDSVVFPFMYYDTLHFLKEQTSVALSSFESEVGHQISKEILNKAKAFIEEVN